LITELKDLKERAHEDFYRQRIGSIFSLYLRKGSEATDWLGDLLHEKVSEGAITAVEMKQVMAADLLWAAETRETKRRIVIAMEASWLAEENDLERAITRAAILRRAGVDALAMVGGHEWVDTLKARAWQANVITTSNGRLDDESWLKAIQSI
jgi:2-methylisocitrate lyase-like PEP mutase family enzyme